MLKALSNYFNKADPLWQKFQQEAEKKAMFTPDMADLQLKPLWHIFLYNECQQDQPKNELLSKAEYRGFGYTQSSDFVLYKMLLGKETFPLAMRIHEDQTFGMGSYLGDPGQIMGEVYTVTPHNIVELDNYLLNEVYFVRQKVPIFIPYKAVPKTEEFSIHEVEVFMWVARADFWEPQLADTERRKLLVPSKRLFTSKENKEELGAHYVFDHRVEASRE